jgi:endonuclease YncB( thermonuclease family)
MATGTVQTFIDGMTFTTVEGETVRLNGIDVPVGAAPGRNAAKAELEELIPAGTVLTLIADTTTTVPSSSTKLYWAFDGAVNVSVQMCVLGYARFAGREQNKVATAGVSTTDYFANNTYIAAVKAASDAAEIALTGLWNTHWKGAFEIEASSPGDGATEVPIDTAITITMTQSVSSASLYDPSDTTAEADGRSWAVSMYNASMVDVECQVTVLANVITVTPSIPLVNDVQHVVRITGADLSPYAVQNRQGDNLAVTQNVFFTTGSKITVDITEDEAAAKGSTIYRPTPIVQRPLEVNATDPEQHATHQSTFPTITVQFTETLDLSGTSAYAAAGTVVEGFKHGVFDETRTAQAIDQTVTDDNLVITISGTPADNTRYVIKIGKDIQSDAGARMETDYEFKFTGPYDPLWIQAEQVRFELGDLAEGVPADLIHTLIHRNCLDLQNRFSLTNSSAQWFHKDYVGLKTQRDLLETLIMSLDAGLSVQMGVGFSERRSDRLPEAIAARLKRIQREIHAIVNTHFFDTHAALARSMVLANSLIDGGLDQVAMTRFFPKPDALSARIGGSRMPTGRAGGGGGGSVLRERSWLNMVMRTYMTVTPA